MTKEQAVVYLRFSGFSDEQIKAIEGAFSCPSAGIDCEDCPAYEDTISRKAVLDTLERMDKALDEDRTVESYKDLLRECYKFLPSVSSSEKPNRWIPVSERLPEKFQRVLVTIVNYKGNKVVRVAEYYNRKVKGVFQIKENHEEWEIGEKGLLAWMPLPEPYKAESEEEE